jgi:hypothetical protein
VRGSSGPLVYPLGQMLASFPGAGAVAGSLCAAAAFLGSARERRLGKVGGGFVVSGYSGALTPCLPPSCDQATFCLDILGVKKNPNGPMYSSMGVMTKVRVGGWGDVHKGQHHRVKFRAVCTLSNARTCVGQLAQGHAPLQASGALARTHTPTLTRAPCMTPPARGPSWRSM